MNPPRKRGRPKGPPKKQKPPSKMGRPSAWSPALGKPKRQNLSAPELFWVAWKIPGYKECLSEFTLDFLTTNCDNKKADSKPNEAD